MRHPVFLVLFCLFAPVAAEAHVSLKTSTPQHNAVLTEPPKVITLTFSGPVEQRFGKFTLVRRTSDEATSGEERLSPGKSSAGPHSIQLPLTLAKPGAYVLHYRLVAGDGHPVKGELHFTYQPE